MNDRDAFRFRVIPTEAGMTLRSLLVRRLPNTDRERAAALIRAGAVYMNRLRVRLGSVRVAAGERVTVYPQALEIPRLDPDTLRIAYRDEDFIVIDKDPGVPVAPTRESSFGCISDALIQLLTREGIARPYVGIMHRLDQRASGLVLFTIRSAFNKSIHHHFADHSITRIYRLLCHGTTPISFKCDKALIELSDGGSRVAQSGEARALEARTHFHTLEHRNSDLGACSLVEARLETGRRHQIRVHCAELGFPIVGERRYANDAIAPKAATPPDEANELHLHAHRLEFPHPKSGETLKIEAEPPAWAGCQIPKNA